MPKLANASSARIADYFVDELFEKYSDSRHIRRVSSWIGLIVLGIERVASTEWDISHERLLRFQCRGRTFKAKYNHELGGRGGGVEIVEILPGRGSPEGDRVVVIRSLMDAAEFYESAESVFLGEDG